MKYTNNSDIHLRLSGVFCRLDSEPVYVQPANGQPESTHVVCRFLLKEGITTIDANSDSLDTSAPPTGWCSLVDTSAYIIRGPERQQLQGLPGMVMSFNPNHPRGPLNRHPLGIKVFKSVGQMILGEYPDFDQARKVLTPWSRELALLKVQDVPVVAVSQLIVGLYDTGGNTVFVHPKYQINAIHDKLKPFMRVSC